MKYHSKIRDASCVMRRALRNTQYAIRNTNKAFTLVEVMTALAILALVSSSVLVVINSCVASAADCAVRMQAFELARENMEKLLASDSVEQMVEFGDSDKHPGIKWQTVVETFYEPISARMWVRAICSAEYVDTAGKTQTVELRHWLTDVTTEQLVEVMKQQQEEQELLADQIIETIEEAAQYAGVDVQTIEQWVDNGMLTTDEGFFLKSNLYLYKKTGGNPSAAGKGLQVGSVQQLLDLIKGQTGRHEREASARQQQDGKVEPATGLTYEELEQMDVSEVFDLLKDRKR